MAKGVQVGDHVVGKVCKTISVAAAKLKQPGPAHKTITMKGIVIARPLPGSRMSEVEWEDGQKSFCASSILERVDAAAGAGAAPSSNPEPTASTPCDAQPPPAGSKRKFVLAKRSAPAPGADAQASGAEREGETGSEPDDDDELTSIAPNDAPDDEQLAEEELPDQTDERMELDDADESKVTVTYGKAEKAVLLEWEQC